MSTYANVDGGAIYNDNVEPNVYLKYAVLILSIITLVRIFLAIDLFSRLHQLL